MKIKTQIIHLSVQTYTERVISHKNEISQNIVFLAQIFVIYGTYTWHMYVIVMQVRREHIQCVLNVVSCIYLCMHM